MYPYELFWGIDLYALLICVGIVAAIVSFRLLADKRDMPSKPFNFFLIIVVVAIASGFLFAMLFQSFYNFMATGVWKWGGMTFLGGLVGSVACFMLFYFSIGHFLFRDKMHITYFYRLVCCAMPCISLAYGIGRFGCLCAGCCYGAVSESFGLPMLVDGVWQKRVPTQIFEAIFGIGLFGVLAFLVIKKDNRYTAQIYLIAYGVWRFCMEYLRDDPRGATGIPFLTPSQLTSLIMVIAGIALVFVYRYVIKRQTPSADPAPEPTQTDGQ